MLCVQALNRRSFFYLFLFLLCVALPLDVVLGNILSPIGTRLDLLIVTFFLLHFENVASLPVLFLFGILRDFVFMHYVGMTSLVYIFIYHFAEKCRKTYHGKLNISDFLVFIKLPVWIGIIIIYLANSFEFLCMSLFSNYWESIFLRCLRICISSLMISLIYMWCVSKCEKSLG